MARSSRRWTALVAFSAVAAALLAGSVSWSQRSHADEVGPFVVGNPGIHDNWTFAQPGDTSIDPQGLDSMSFSITRESESDFEYYKAWQVEHRSLVGGVAPIVTDVRTPAKKGIGSVTTDPFSTKLSADLVLALVATKPGAAIQITNNAGLKFQRKAPATTSTQSTVEVWWASLNNGQRLTNATVTASGAGGESVMLSVVANSGAREVKNVVLNESAGGTTSPAPNVTITPAQTSSQVIAVGFDRTAATTVSVGTGQTRDQFLQMGTTTGWVQHANATTTGGSAVKLTATLGRKDPWSMLAIELEPQGGNRFYIGLGGRFARFSAFGRAQPADPSVWPANKRGECDEHPDAGIGTGCYIDIDARKGHTYELKVEVVPYSVNSNLWLYKGTVRDTSVAGGPEKTIGLWTVPKTWGKLNPSTGGFLEKPGGDLRTCDDMPYARYRLGRPSAKNSDGRTILGNLNPGSPDRWNGCAAGTAVGYSEDGATLTMGTSTGAAPVGSVTTSGTGPLTNKPFSVKAYPKAPGQTAPGHLYLASIATWNGQVIGTPTSTGTRWSDGQPANLAWSLVKQQRDAGDSSGVVEIWQARSSEPIKDLQVTAPVTGPPGWSSTLTVHAFAEGTAVGATGGASGTNGRPAVGITTSNTGSYVFGVGYDWSGMAEPEPVTAQFVDHRYIDTTQQAGTWDQHVDDNEVLLAGTTVTLADTLPPTDYWAMAAVEVKVQPPLGFVVPATPTNVTAAVATDTSDDRSALISFTPPAAGSAPITTYRVAIYNADGSLASIGAGGYQGAVKARNLTVGSTYTFRLLAGNPYGGALSAMTNPVTIPAAPGVPTNVRVGFGDGKAIVCWDAPAPNGTPAITSYRIVGYQPGGVKDAEAWPGANTCGIYQAPNGTNLAFRIIASNGTEGLPSAPTAPVTFGAPGNPTNVTAVAATGSATVSWTAPGDNGTAPVTAYTVTAYKADGTVATTRQVTAPSTSAAVTGLTTGSAYTFRVTASNTWAGPPSAASSPVTIR